MEKHLFDTNFVYFAIYIAFTASIGQYVLWKKVSTFVSNASKAFGKAKVTIAKRQKAQTVNVVDIPTPVELVSKPDLQYKVNRKETEKQLAYIRQQRAIDAGMHNLTSKFNTKTKA